MELGKDLALVIAWPKCWAKAPESLFGKLKKVGFFKSDYFQLGHTGILLINGTSGQVEYFDFGRYSTGEYQGRVRSRRSDPKLGIDVLAKLDAKGDLENLKELLWSIKSKQYEMHGEEEMHIAVCKNYNFRQGKLFAESLQDAGSQDYGSINFNKINCANFVQKVLLKGIKCKKTKFHLRLPLTLLLPTPIGNIEAIPMPENYIVNDHEIIAKKRLSQWAVVKYTFRATVINVTRKNLEVKALSHLLPPVRDPRIPVEAQWLGGQGEGTWLTLTPIMDKNTSYRIRGMAANGETEYDYFVKMNYQEFDLERPYLFVSGCSRLGVTIVQDNKKIRLIHHKDFQGVS